jgi:hypothetical protein
VQRQAAARLQRLLCQFFRNFVKIPMEYLLWWSLQQGEHFNISFGIKVCGQLGDKQAW